MDPKERLKSECEGIVLSPQRRSFTTGCQVTQSVVKEDSHERGTHDKGNRQAERDMDGLGRDRNRESRGNDHRNERNMYDRGLEKDDLPLNFREGRRRDGANDIEERGRRVGSGRIPPNRIDRDRGMGGEEYGMNERVRIDRMREQNPMDRNSYNNDNRERVLTERRGMPSNDRREIGRDDNRDQNNSRTRFIFEDIM